MTISLALNLLELSSLHNKHLHGSGGCREGISSQYFNAIRGQPPVKQIKYKTDM